MTYSYNGFGSYYSYTPHTAYAGYGNYGYGSYGFGAIDTGDIRQSFNGAQVWSDAQLGGSISVLIQAGQEMGCPSDPSAPGCPENRAAQGRANAAGNRAANQVRKGLIELGYAEPGELTLNTMWGGADQAAWKRFTADQGMAAGPGLINRAGVMKMEELLRAGKSPGPSKAGLGKVGWLLLLAAGAAATVAVVGGKRRRKPATGRAIVPMR